MKPNILWDSLGSWHSCGYLIYQQQDNLELKWINVLIHLIFRIQSEMNLKILRNSVKTVLCFPPPFCTSPACCVSSGYSTHSCFLTGFYPKKFNRNRGQSCNNSEEQLNTSPPMSIICCKAWFKSPSLITSWTTWDLLKSKATVAMGHIPLPVMLVDETGAKPKTGSTFCYFRWYFITLMYVQVFIFLISLLLMS